MEVNACAVGCQGRVSLSNGCTSLLFVQLLGIAGARVRACVLSSTRSRMFLFRFILCRASVLCSGTARDVDTATRRLHNTAKPEIIQTNVPDTGKRLRKLVLRRYFAVDRKKRACRSTVEFVIGFVQGRIKASAGPGAVPKTRTPPTMGTHFCFYHAYPTVSTRSQK